MTLPYTSSRAHVCDRPVTRAVEGYSPRDGLVHGSLDLVMHVCPEHVETARQVVSMVWGLTPYTALMVGTAGVDFAAQCGEVTDWTTPSEIVMPVQSVSEGDHDELQEHDEPSTAPADLKQIRPHERNWLDG